MKILLKDYIITLQIINGRKKFRKKIYKKKLKYNKNVLFNQKQTKIIFIIYYLKNRKRESRIIKIINMMNAFLNLKLINLRKI